MKLTKQGVRDLNSPRNHRTESDLDIMDQCINSDEHDWLARSNERCYVCGFKLQHESWYESCYDNDFGDEYS